MDIAKFLRSILPGADKYIEGAEILTDGGLETWTSETNLTSWTEDNAGTGSVNREGTEKHGGTYAAKLSRAGSGYAGIWQGFKLVPGKRYRVSFWYKGTVGALLFGTVVENGWLHNIISPILSCSASWQRYEADFEGLEGYSDFVLYFNNSNTNDSDIYIDDLSLKPLTPAGVVSCWLPGSTISAPVYAPGTELLTDGGLETWISPTNLTEWVEQVGGSSTLNRESSDKHSGSYALRMDIDSNNAYCNAGQSVALVAGQRYRLSLWRKGSTAQAKGSIVVVQEESLIFLQNDLSWSTNWNSVPVPTSASWAQWQIEFVAPMTGWYLMQLRAFDAASASLYWDDVSLATIIEVGTEDRAGRVTDIIRGNHGTAYGRVIPEVPAHGYCKEMLTDGGLEVWASATNLTNWAEELSGTSSVNRESTVKRGGGSYSCRMDVDAGNGDALINQTTGVSLKAGTPYLWSFWYKHDLGKTARAIVRDSSSSLYLKSDGSWDTSFANIVLPSSTTWARYTIRFVPTLDTTYVLYVGSLSAASSSIYFDDISLLEFQETLGPEILVDGGIETWDNATHPHYWNQSQDGTSSVNREAVNIHGGTYACRIDTDGAGNPAQIYQLFGLVPGKRYRLSFWHRDSGAGGAVCYFRDQAAQVFLTGDGLWSGVSQTFSVPDSSTYRLYQVDFVCPAGYQSFMFQYLSGQVSTSVYIDDVSLREVLSPSIETDLGWTFDGKTGNIRILDESPQNLSFDQFTVGLWAQVTGDTQGELASHYGGDYKGHQCYQTPDWISAGVWTPSTGVVAASPHGKSVGEWVFVAYLYDGTNITLYLDGVLADSHAAGYTKPDPDYGEGLVFGKASWYDGLLDSGGIAMPFIANRPISAQEIANIYNATKGFFYPRG